MNTTEFFATEKISKILLKLAPPVMLAQLIQALYNIVDSLFIGRYSDSGLTALSIIYPIQLLMIALAVGTGVGINTIMAAKIGVGKGQTAQEYAGVGTLLAVALWLLFAVVGYATMPIYAKVSTDSPEVIADVILYGRIVCVCSLGLFLESVWTKVLQAEGDMKTPMTAQILGAVTNIILDPLLIFGMLGFPQLGIAGAAIATVAGQVAAALVVMKNGWRKSPSTAVYGHHIKKIFRLGVPNILMQSAYTFYILGLNLILAGFSDAAVTALGLYYKWQTFFFIPLGAMQTCIVPLVSFNYAAGNIDRCKETLKTAILFGLALISTGTISFELIPEAMLGIFTADKTVIQIGTLGFRFIGISYLPMVTALIFPVFFQAVGAGFRSSFLTIVRTVLLFVPLGYLFSRFGLEWFWLTFPVTEITTTLVGVYFYRQFLTRPYTKISREEIPSKAAIQPSRPGVIITIGREHGTCGKQIGKLLAQKLNVPFYYKELTALAAKETGMDREFITDITENTPQLLHDLYLSTTVVQQAVIAQHKIIRRIADNGSCVIVGRAADYVLRDRSDVVKVFLYAPNEYRIRKVMEMYGDNSDHAVYNIRRSDAARSAYYRTITGGEWGNRHQYHLLIDASIGPEMTADLILRYLSDRKLVPAAKLQHRI